jgi:hypothetical protein
MSSGWTDYWQKSTYTMKHNDLTDIGESDHHVKYTDAEALNVFKANLEPVPTYTPTKAAASSWSYTHKNNASAHHTKYTDGEALSVFQDNLETSPTDIATKAPTSSWAYAHENDVDAHHAKYTDAEALSVFQANLEEYPTATPSKAPASTWAYSHENDVDAHHAKYTDGEALSVFQANLEANPTNGETGKAANSNWSYDHAANASAHHAKYTDGEALSVFQANLEANPTNGETGKAANSNWSYDHAANASAHHAKYTNAEAVAAVTAADTYIKNTGDTASGDYNFCSSLFVMVDASESITMGGSPGDNTLECGGTAEFHGGILAATIIEGTTVTQNTIYDGVNAVIGDNYGIFRCNGALYNPSGYIHFLCYVERISSSAIRLHGIADTGVIVTYDCADGSATTVTRIILAL